MKRKDIIILSSIFLLLLPNLMYIRKVGAEAVIYDPTNPSKKVQPLEGKIDNDEENITNNETIHQSSETKDSETSESITEQKEQVKPTKKRKKKMKTQVILTDDFSVVVNDFSNSFPSGGGNGSGNSLYTELVHELVGTLLYGRKN